MAWIRTAPRRSGDCSWNSTPQGTTIFLSSHLLAEIEQMCTRVGVLRRGQLILQEELDTLLKPTGLVAVRTRDIDKCVALLGPAVGSVAGERLLVRAKDPARLNAYLVGEGIRVDEIGPYRRTLSDVVFEAEARGDRRRVDQDAAPAADLAHHRHAHALPTLVAVLLAVTDLGPRPGTVRRSSRQS